MNRDFSPILPDAAFRHDLRRLIELAWAEDVGEGLDITSEATIPREKRGDCAIRSRTQAIAAGVITIPWIIQSLNFSLTFEPHVNDGETIQPGQSLGKLSGNARQLLAAERLILNITSRLCGVATLTSHYVRQLEGTEARLYDTRKTTAGWRRLEKYAVRCGGGHNHRTGLFDAILIKDNHLALAGSAGTPLDPRSAILQAREWLAANRHSESPETIIEIEVDSLEQMQSALTAPVDVILVDNFSLEELAEAVRLRNLCGKPIELEASGGVTLDRIAKIAATGVDRISCGALTHQATWIDLGLDWIGQS